MREVRVKGEELNGLGLTLKQIIDGRVRDPQVWNAVKKLNGSLVVRETGADVAVTILFDSGDLLIQNGAVDKPSAYVEGSFEELADVSSGQVGPVMAVLARRVRAGGNLLKLLRMSKVIITS